MIIPSYRSAQSVWAGFFRCRGWAQNFKIFADVICACSLVLPSWISIYTIWEMTAASVRAIFMYMLAEYFQRKIMNSHYMMLSSLDIINSINRALMFLDSLVRSITYSAIFLQVCIILLLLVSSPRTCPKNDGLSHSAPLSQDRIWGEWESLSVLTVESILSLEFRKLATEDLVYDIVHISALSSAAASGHS